MGNKPNKTQFKPASPQELDQHIADLLTTDPQKLNIHTIQSHIIHITHHIVTYGSLGKKEQGYWVNPIILKIVYHVRFQAALRQLFKLMLKELKSILQSKLLTLTPKQSFQKCLNVSKFCVFFADQNLLKDINLLVVRSDLHPQTKQILKQLNNNAIEIGTEIFQTMPQEELITIAKDIRVSINIMIDLHTKLLTRSDFTMSFIDRLGQCLFLFYAKIYFQVKSVHRKQKLEQQKTLLKIGAAYAGMGLDLGLSPIYQTSILILLDVLKSTKIGGEQPDEKKKKQKKLKALPSHLFKTLPVINSGELFNWLTCIILFGLSYIKEDEKYLSRLNANRIPTFKLLTILIEKYQCNNNQITYLLESLCLQIKPSMIQRVYLAEIADKYSKFNSESAIIKKYSTMKTVAFNVKSKKSTITFRPDEVRTELQSDENEGAKEITHTYSKFVNHIILQRFQIRYEYGDKALWASILSQKQSGQYNNEKQYSDGQQQKEIPRLATNTIKVENSQLQQLQQKQMQIQ